MMEQTCSSTDSSSWSEKELNVNLNALAALSLGKEPSIPIEQKAGSIPV
jgi:hypothetical protein